MTFKNSDDTCVEQEVPESLLHWLKRAVVTLERGLCIKLPRRLWDVLGCSGMSEFWELKWETVLQPTGSLRASWSACK